MGKKLVVYMIDGTENGPRTIEIGNWSGKAFHSPRSNIVETINRPEFDNPGVYILKSDPIEDIFSERIYIGEAENIKSRIKQHLRNSDKDFKEIIFFISKDELLTKSHVKYIESKLISSAKENGLAELENNTVPSATTLSEADISDMEYFIDQIKIILPTAGYNFLIQNTVYENQQQKTSEKIIRKFSIKNKKYNSTMLETEKGFIVEKGSEVNKEISKSISTGWIKLREQLIKNNILIEQGNKYIFTKDTIFSSTSAASSIILGRQSAGPIEWIDETGKTFKDYESEVIDNE